MNPLACPRCGEPCLTFWSKTSLGPAKRKRCRSCGQSVSVPWLHSLAIGFLSSVVTIVAGVGAMALLDPLPPGWLALACVLGMLAANVPLVWLHYRFVPLVARAG